MPHVTITAKGASRTYEIRSGLGFQALCERHRTAIEFDCREADCGICIMRVTEGKENLSTATPEERDFLKAMRADADERLACQCRIMGDVKVLVEDA